MEHYAMRDDISRYLGHTADDPAKISAGIHLGMLTDMEIKLTDAEIAHLFSLPSERAIENWCHKIIVERL